MMPCGPSVVTPHDWVPAETIALLVESGWRCVHSSEPTPSKLGPVAGQTWHRTYGTTTSELYIHICGDCELRPNVSLDYDILTCRLRVLRAMLKRWRYAK